MVFFVFSLLACIENSITDIRQNEDFDAVGPTQAFDTAEWDTGYTVADGSEDEPLDDNSEDTQTMPPEQDEETNPDPPNGQSESHPRFPVIGDLSINELMINPDSVLDKHGEWVELFNDTDDWVTLEGTRLSDDGVDDIEIEESSPGSLIVPPGGFAVICANDNFWNNGGVNCNGTFHYQTFGGGFGLSNTEDEIRLSDQNGQVLDVFEYTSGFAPVGQSMGVDPDFTAVSDNDETQNWCEQFSILPQGDSASPGLINDHCY